MRPPGTQEQLEQRRLRALALVEEGHCDAEIARLLNTTRTSVGRWRKAARRRGPKALAAKPVSGRPPCLTPRQKRGLVSRLLRGPLAHGFDTDLWTCPRIVELIETHYGVRYHVDHIPRLMASLGLSCQKPKRQAVERDGAAIQRWVQKDWPRIKKHQT